MTQVDYTICIRNSRQIDSKVFSCRTKSQELPDAAFLLTVESSIIVKAGFGVSESLEQFGDTGDFSCSGKLSCSGKFFFLKKTRFKSSYGTNDEVGRAKSSYGMSSSKILRINGLIEKENQIINAGRDLK